MGEIFWTKPASPRPGRHRGKLTFEQNRMELTMTKDEWLIFSSWIGH